MCEPFTHKQKLGVNQLRLIAALLEGPILGIGQGPRRAVDFLDIAIPWLNIPARESCNSPMTRQSLASKALAALLEKGLVTREDVKVKGRQCYRAHFKLTKLGLAQYKMQTDKEYKAKVLAAIEKRRAKQKATYLPWRATMDPTIRWKRWYAGRKGWKVLVELHPVDGWRFKLVTPDHRESKWTTATEQDEFKTKRETEATLRHYLAKENEKE